MMPVRLYGRILAAAALLSLFVMGIELIAYSPETVLPREEICIQPETGGGLLAGHLDALFTHTGTAAARLARLRATIGPDGVPVSVDLDFYTGPKGENRLYQITYRQDTGTCGWTDGLSYQAGTGEMPATLPADAGQALAALGNLRLPELAGYSAQIETRQPAAGAGETAVLPERRVRENGTPAGPGEWQVLPFSLLVSEKICTQAGSGRDVQCSVVPVERIRFVDAG